MSETAHLNPIRLAANTIALGAGGSILASVFFPVRGQARVTGSFTLGAGMAPAAGFPRIRQTIDSVNFGTVQVMQDLSQLPAIVFPFDAPIQNEFLSLEYTNGAVAGSIVVVANAMPE
jgi:hypothetical protein